MAVRGGFGTVGIKEGLEGGDGGAGRLRDEEDWAEGTKEGLSTESGVDMVSLDCWNFEDESTVRMF